MLAFETALSVGGRRGAALLVRGSSMKPQRGEEDAPFSSSLFPAGWLMLAAFLLSSLPTPGKARLCCLELHRPPVWHGVLRRAQLSLATFTPPPPTTKSMQSRQGWECCGQEHWGYLSKETEKLVYRKLKVPYLWLQHILILGGTIILKRCKINKPFFLLNTILAGFKIINSSELKWKISFCISSP